MNNSYKLVVTPKKNGSFDYSVVEVTTGKVIGTRNSFRRYVAATVVRENAHKLAAYLSRHINHAEQHPEQWSPDSVQHNRKQLDGVVAMIAEGRQFPAGVLSFNSKPTPLTSRQAEYLDFLGFAVA